MSLDREVDSKGKGPANEATADTASLAANEATAAEVLAILRATGAWNHRDHGLTAIAEIGRLVAARGAEQTLEEARWYADHCRERYCPKIVSLATMDKWPRIRLAMEERAPGAPDPNADCSWVTGGEDKL